MLTDEQIDVLQGDALSIEIAKLRGEEWELRDGSLCPVCRNEMHPDSERSRCVFCNEWRHIACPDYAGDLNVLFGVVDELQERRWTPPSFRHKNRVAGTRKASLTRYTDPIRVDEIEGFGPDLKTALARCVCKALQIEQKANKPC